jgi:hypothetical protein
MDFTNRNTLVAFFAPSFLGRAMRLGAHFNNVIYCYDFRGVTIDGVSIGYWIY